MFFSFSVFSFPLPFQKNFGIFGILGVRNRDPHCGSLGKSFSVFTSVALCTKINRCKDGKTFPTDKTVIVALNTTMQVALMSSLVDAMRRPRSVFVLAALFTLSIVASIYLSHGHESNRQNQIFHEQPDKKCFMPKKYLTFKTIAQAGGGCVV